MSRSLKVTPQLVTALTVILAAAFWWVTDRNERQLLQTTTSVTVREAGNRLDNYLNGVISQARSIEALWLRTEQPVKESSFHELAGQIVKRIPELQALNWVDPDGVIHWVHPEDANAAAKGRDLRQNEIAGPVFSAAEELQQARLTPPLQLYQGQTGVASYIPILENGRVHGYVNVVLRVEPVLQACFDANDVGLFHYAVADAGAWFFPSEFPPTYEGDEAHTYSARILDRPWTIALAPTPRLRDLVNSSWNDLFSIVALLLGIGLGVLTRRVIHARERLATQEREQHKFLIRLIDSIPNFVFLKDTDGRFTLVNKSVADAFGTTPDHLLGRTDAELNDNADEVEFFREIDKRVLETRRDIEIPEETLTDANGNLRWLQTIKRAIVDPDGNATHVLGVCTDITERKAAEQRQGLMMRELDHRVKNNLAAILSLTKQTLATATDLEEFGEVFIGRISALTRSHEALAEARWAGFNLRESAEMILSAFESADEQRIHYAGGDLTLPPATATPVSLVLHELATNAVKYGALSTTEGRIALDWEKQDDAYVIRWTESGGPPVIPPTQTGTGTQLIRGFIEYQLRGHVELEFDSAGLRCTITLPRSDRSARSAPTPEIAPRTPAPS